MLLATHNLGTKLMRWTSSIDYDRVGVSSLTVCQCSDEGGFFFQYVLYFDKSDCQI